MKRYFAVKNGRSCGIYTDFKRCQQSVLNYSGAEYKGFNTRLEAMEYLGLPKTIDKMDVIEYLPEELSNKSDTDTLVAYIDGSYVKQITTRYVGAGIVLIHPETNDKETYSFKIAQAIELGNVAGELAASMHAMKMARDKGYKKLKLHYDYNGCEKWLNNEWQPKNKYTKLYKTFYEKKIRPYLDVEFIKVKSHSKDLYNDEADMLARRALVY